MTIVFMHSQAQSVPHFDCQYLAGPGVNISKDYADLTLCREVTLEIAIIPSANTPFFLRFTESPELDYDWAGLPSDVTITDPVYEHPPTFIYEVELAFPGVPAGEDDIVEPVVFQMKLKLKPGHFPGGVPGRDLPLLAHYDQRNQEGFPLYWSSADVGYRVDPYTYIEGQDVSVAALLNSLQLGQAPYSQAHQIGLNGSLVVDTDWSYWVGGGAKGNTIFMYDGARIAVEDALFSLGNTTVRACESWWDAIELREGGFLAMAQNNGIRGGVKDAVHGVRFLPGCHGADLNGVDFFDNMVSLYSPPVESGPLHDFQLIVENCHFKKEDFEMPPVLFDYVLAHPWAAMELNDMFEWINDCSSGPHCGNLIQGMYHGMILNNCANVRIRGFRIQHIQSDPADLIPYAGHGCLVQGGEGFNHFEMIGYGKDGDYVFKNVPTAIRVNNVRSRIRNIRMESVGTGIVQSGNFYRDIEILSNKIYAKNHGILSLFNQGAAIRIKDNDVLHYQLLGGGVGTENVGYGIALINNFTSLLPARVEGNYVRFPRAIAGIHALNSVDVEIAENTVIGGSRNGEYGIQISGGTKMAIDCNLLERPSGSVSDPSAGIYIQMMDGGAIRCNEISDYPRGIEYFGMSLGSLMEGNTLTDHHIGLLYDHEAGTGIHEWSGNRWTTEYDTENDEIGAWNTNVDEGKVDKSKYYVDITPSATHSQYGTSVKSQHDWFVILEDGDSTLQCGTSKLISCDDGPGARSIGVRPPDSLAWWIAVDSFASPNYGGGAVWTARRQLYRRLAAAPEYVTPNSEWEDFMETHATSSVGIYESIRAAWLNLPVETDQIREDIAQAVFLQDSLIIELADVMTALTETTDSTEQQTLIGQQVDLETSLAENTLYLDTLYTALAAIRAEHIMNLDSVNQAAPTTEDWMIAQRHANMLLFKAALEGMPALDSLELDALEDIAAECPMVLGEAVFQARGLLAILDPGLQWDDAAICAMAEPRYSHGVVSMSESLTAWPNPARSAISIDLGGGAGQVWDITLFNAYGVSVKSWRYPSGYYQLELADIPSGVYTLQARGADGQRLNSRVILSR
jgi:hypothetical protein